MNDPIPAKVADDDMMEIYPPERKTCPGGLPSRCDCCGQFAAMGEDCFGLCEECLSP